MEDTKPNVTQGATGGGDAGAGAGAGNDTKPEDGGSTITIRIRDQTGEETFFKVKRSTKMDKVFKAYADRKGVPSNSLRFMLDGDRVEGSETPEQLDLEDQDQIDCMLEQQGGSF